jgi:hypothetical protein
LAWLSVALWWRWQEIGKHSTIKRGTILWTFNQNKSKRKVGDLKSTRLARTEQA